jgi:predicted tellurium resistance membrane protein TerC
MPEDEPKKEATTIWQAVKLIVIADITLSIDNMLAVGGASHGNLLLLLFGLAVSVPFVVFTSDFLSRLMDRYPVIIVLGAAILGKVGADMVVTDPMVANLLSAGHWFEYAAQGLGAAGVLVAGKLVMMRAAKRREAEAPAQSSPVLAR